MANATVATSGVGPQQTAATRITESAELAELMAKTVEYLVRTASRAAVASTSDQFSRTPSARRHPIVDVSISASAVDSASGTTFIALGGSCTSQ